MAFLCSLTKELRVFRPEIKQKAVYHDGDSGPSFGSGAISIGPKQMNSKDCGVCFTNNVDQGMYNIPVDAEGKSVLTGDGGSIPSDYQDFTCTELEVFRVTLSQNF